MPAGGPASRIGADTGLLAGHAQKALGLLQAGRVSEAEAICRQIVASHPAYFHALHLLGIIALQRQDHSQAAEWLSAALAVSSSHPQAHSNLAIALLALRRPDEALACCQRALELNPDFAEALSNQGDALYALNRLHEALASYDRAIVLAPTLCAAHFGRGNALLKIRRPEDALAAFDAALHLSPEHASALNGRGCALQALKRLPEAIRCFESALRLYPKAAEALFNESNAWLELGSYEEAIGRSEQALALNPRYAAALNTKANALWRLNRFGDAAQAYAQLRRMDPEFPYAVGNLFYCRANVCDWRDRAELESTIRALGDADRRASLPLGYLSVTDSAAAQLRCARLYAQDHPKAIVPLWRGERYRHDRIRVAYVSGDLRDHAVSYLLAGLFEQHDARRFEIFAISLREGQPSTMGQRVREAFEHFIDVSRFSNREAARLMREMEIDIAIDLAGFTGGMRMEIFAQRPAPIQVSYLGFPGTTGTEYMDYLVADEFLVPTGCERFYAEQIVYLPDCFQGNDDKRVVGDADCARENEGLPEERFVFCSFNSSYKISPRFFDVWMRLLKVVPDSVLWILAESEEAERNLRREAGIRGVGAEQLVFAKPRPYGEHIGRLKLADLFLDTLPFNAGTTASDALWAGLPVLTCAGEAFAARMAGSLLNAVGLPELITHGLEEYEATARYLGVHRSELRALRNRLIRNRGERPLFNTDRFRRHLESAYLQMWERHQRGESPSMLRVQSLS